MNGLSVKKFGEFVWGSFWMLLIGGILIGLITSDIWTQRPISGFVTYTYIKDNGDGPDYYHATIQLDNGTEEEFQNIVSVTCPSTTLGPQG